MIRLICAAKKKTGHRTDHIPVPTGYPVEAVFWDITISVALALCAFATGLLGFYLTLHPTNDVSIMRRYKAAFGGIGLITVALVLF